jgi:hypothetical protein
MKKQAPPYTALFLPCIRWRGKAKVRHELEEQLQPVHYGSSGELTNLRAQAAEVTRAWIYLPQSAYQIHAHYVWKSRSHPAYFIPPMDLSPVSTYSSCPILPSCCRGNALMVLLVEAFHKLSCHGILYLHLYSSVSL